MLKRTEKTILKVKRALDKSVEGVSFAKGILDFVEHEKNVTPEEFRKIRSEIKKRLNWLAKHATV